MHPYIAAVRVRVDAFLDGLYRRRPIIGLVLVGLLAVAGIVWHKWVDDTALPAVWGALKTVSKLPVGIFGLLFVVLLFSLLLIAFVDTSPTAAALKELLGRRSQAEPAPLSAADRGLVQDLRANWNRYGEPAASRLYDLLQEVRSETKSHFWSELLNPKLGELKGATEAMAEGVADDSVMAVEQVRKRYNALFSAYFQACRWVAEITGQDQLKFSQDPYKAHLAQWQALHRAFHDKLEDLDQVPEHKGTLWFHLHVGAGNSLKKFVRAAESPPEPDRFYR